MLFFRAFLGLGRARRASLMAVGETAGLPELGLKRSHVSTGGSALCYPAVLRLGLTLVKIDNGKRH